MTVAAQAKKRTAPRLGPYRWKDFVALEEDDLRELEDGEFVEGEMPTKEHEWAQAKLLTRMVLWAEERNAGEVLGAGYKIRINEARGVMPDVQFYRRGSRAKALSEGLVSGHPDVVVEIVSKHASDQRRDRVRKLRDYAAIGVPEYWIVDPDGRTLERFVLKDKHYSNVESLSGTDTFRPKSCPGLVVPLSKLWLPAPKPKPRAKAKAKPAKSKR